MNSSNEMKKIKKKLRKLEHVILKETGIICVTEPTKHLALLNVGLANGLSEEIIFENFAKYGIIENIILLPGKSCSFISYTEVTCAHEALKNCNGKLNIAQDYKPVYISHVGCLPIVKSNKCWDKLPPGLIIIENFITDDDEIAFLKKYGLEQNPLLGNMKHRQVKHYGYEFIYDINNVDKEKPLNEKVPTEFNSLWEKLKKINNISFCPDQLTINKYNPGQGIPHHVDTHSAFEDPIISLSLQSSVIMDFKKDDQHLCVLLPRKSLAIISGESRYDWTHGITPRKFDIVLSQNGYTNLERGTRISFTFRKILQGECNCNYKTKCDSYNKINGPKIKNTIASELEKIHVHEVYENIASHFSDTRHKPWPNVLKFVQSFETGSTLIDIGCGNGKYLSQNKNIFDIGCDQSTGLISVCRERGFEVFSGNCLSIPIKDNSADGVISIAVIHHLANEERRLSSIKEITRILRKGGRALIYVWAKDQHKDKQKSSYIKQDRKNRKVIEDTIVENSGASEEVSILQDVTLPIHTNRTQFQHSDLLVPWKLKGENENNNTFLRFYHVFEENELENLWRKLDNIEIIESYYDQGNWCVVIKKINAYRYSIIIFPLPIHFRKFNYLSRINFNN